MKLFDLMNEIKSGENLRRICWDKDVFMRRCQNAVDFIFFTEHVITSKHKLNIDDVFSDDWEVIDDHKMTFTEMMPHLKQGMKARRKIWDESVFVSIKNDLLFKSDGHCSCTSTVSYYDYIANDWIIF